MYKVLSETLYNGTFNDIEYTKVLLLVSENNKWPKLISVSPEVYADLGQKLINKTINLYFTENYGKFKVSKIEIVE